MTISGHEYNSPTRKITITGNLENDSSFSFSEVSSEPRTRLQRRNARITAIQHSPKPHIFSWNDYKVDFNHYQLHSTNEITGRQLDAGYTAIFDESDGSDGSPSKLMFTKSKTVVCVPRRRIRSSEYEMNHTEVEFEESQILNLMEAASISGAPLAPGLGQLTYPLSGGQNSRNCSINLSSNFPTPNMNISDGDIILPPTSEEISVALKDAAKLAVEENNSEEGGSARVRNKLRTSIDRMKEGEKKVDALRLEREKKEKEEEEKLRKQQELKIKEEEEAKQKALKEKEDMRKKEAALIQKKEEEIAAQKKIEEDKIHKINQKTSHEKNSTEPLVPQSSPSIIITPPQLQPAASPVLINSSLSPSTSQEFETELLLLTKLRKEQMSLLKVKDKNFYNTIIKLAKSTINKVSNLISRIEIPAADIASKLKEIRSMTSSEKDQWANLLALKLADAMIDSLAELKLGENPSAVFSKAHFVVLAFKDDTAARQILLARLVEECPTSIPKDTKLNADDATNAAFTQRKSELIAMHVCLRLAILIKAGDLGGVWRWFARMANKSVDALEAESVALSMRFLGFALDKVYKKQWEKMVLLFAGPYRNAVVSSNATCPRANSLIEYGAMLLKHVTEEDYMKPREGKAAMSFAKPEDFEPVLEVQKLEDA